MGITPQRASDSNTGQFARLHLVGVEAGSDDAVDDVRLCNNLQAATTRGSERRTVGGVPRARWGDGHVTSHGASQRGRPAIAATARDEDISQVITSHSHSDRDYQARTRPDLQKRTEA